MSVRLATFDDMTALLDLMEHAREASCYSVLARVDEGQGHRVVFNAIAAMREPAEPHATVVVVADGADGIEGALVGVLRPLYEVLDAQVASDLFWYCRPEASPRAALRLLRRFHDWAKTWPGELVLRHGVHDAISDPRRPGRVFEAQGFRQAGVIYEKEVCR